jgi:hypothetical protein
MTPSMRQYLQSELGKREDELKAHDARVAVLRTEIALLRQILAKALDQSQPTPDVGGRNAMQEQSVPMSANGRDPAHREASASLSKKWAVVRDEAVRRFPECITNADVASIQRDNGFEPTSGSNVRSYFYNAVKSGLYKRVEPGVYRATQKAADVAGVQLGVDGRAAESDERRDDRESSRPSSELLEGAA